MKTLLYKTSSSAPSLPSLEDEQEVIEPDTERESSVNSLEYGSEASIIYDHKDNLIHVEFLTQ